MTAPIPYEGHLCRAVRRRHEEAEQAKVLVAIAREVDGKLERAPSRGFEFPMPADLRGIPAIGMGVPGVIRGSSPHGWAEAA